MSLQIVSNLYLTSWGFFKAVRLTVIIVIIIFVIYVVYAVIYISKFIYFLAFTLFDLILFPLLVLFARTVEVFPILPS